MNNTKKTNAQFPPKQTETYMSLSRRNTLRLLKHRSNKSLDLISSIQQPNTQEKVASKIEDYHFSKTLGRGSYALVRLATNKKTKGVVAIKTYEKMKLADPIKKASVDREIKILRTLEHPNIIKYIDCFNDRT